MPLSSPIYGDYNGIFLIFIPLTLKKLWVPERNCSEIFYFEKSVVFRTLQLLRTTLRKSCRRINAHRECSAGLVKDLRSGMIRYYSKKPSSRVTTRCDEEYQAFLTMDCDSLQGPLTYTHSLSVNGSSSIAP